MKLKEFTDLLNKANIDYKIVEGRIKPLKAIIFADNRFKAGFDPKDENICPIVFGDNGRRSFKLKEIIDYVEESFKIKDNLIKKFLTSW